MANEQSSVSSSEQDGGQTLVLAVKGHFDFSAHRDFREGYKDSDGVKLFIVELRETEYIDSSALGMLLLLREYAHGNGGEVVLRHAARDVRNILAIANFDKLFRIED